MNTFGNQDFPNRPSAGPRPGPFDRRSFLAYFSGLGLSSTLLPGVLWAQASKKGANAVTVASIKEAEKLAGLEFTDDEREMMTRGVNSLKKSLEQLRSIPISNATPPALHFNPLLPGETVNTDQQTIVFGDTPKVERPANLEDVAFWPVTHLGALLRAQGITSVELTEMYLARLRRFDEQLHCVVTFTDELAMRQAKRADDELAAGKDRGPLHGIPWGAKDLLATRGYPTTWGAAPFKDQVIDMDAAVVERLDAAGAVLIAKLTLGALAMGDYWYKDRTRNPWNAERGSSGSSAGPASATAAGLVGFSIGSETLGSIVSPCTACGVTGLRPTYGRVSRHGAMALSWSMDKLGPMCRTAEDCALVFDAIRGADGRDVTLIDAAFNYDANIDMGELRVGYAEDTFTDRAMTNGNGAATLETLRSLGANPIPMALPDMPTRPLGIILDAEAAAAFDDLTRSGQDDALTRQGASAWPNAFRTARFIPAVEYIQANRARTLLMEAMRPLFEEVDVYIAPPWGGSNLLITNLTGHPSVVLPNGFTDKGMPTSMTFMANLFDEARLLAFARAFQNATVHHRAHPPLSV
jgi:Asp-tRNA(Asn)/Glu-tRNA(Gln) amidotransferase A subunit family amidase